MKTIVDNERLYYLMHFLWHWKSTKPSVKIRHDSSVSRSLTGVENATVSGEDCSLSGTAEILLARDELSELSTNLLNNPKYFAIPLWAERRQWGDHLSSKLSTPYYMGWSSNTHYDIYQTPPISKQHDFIVPVVLCRMEYESIDLSAPYVGTYKIKWYQDCHHSSQALPRLVAGNPSHAHNWTDKLKMDFISIVRDKTYGNNPESVRTGEYDPVRRSWKITTLLKDGEISDLISHFYSVGNTTSFEISAPSLNGETVRVRYLDDTIDIKYLRADLCEVKYSLVETSVSTITKTARLFEFTYNVDPVVTYRYTDNSRPIELSGHEYIPHPIECSSFEFGGIKDQRRVSLKAGITPDSVFQKFVPYRVEAPIRLRVYEVQTSSLNLEPTVKFEGLVTGVEPNGKDVKVLCVPNVGNVLTGGPNMVIRNVCNNRFGDARCGLNKNHYKIPCTVGRSNGFSVQVSGYSGMMVGSMLIVGSGETYESRSITAQAGSTINLDKPLYHNRLGGSGYIQRVCNRTMESCKDFLNFKHFSGFPYIPENNPTVTLRETKQGGKK